MKVKDLEKGMLLKCVDKDHRFIIRESIGSHRWLHVTRYPRRFHHTLNSKPRDWSENRTIMYLGTKKDVPIKMPWCDKFVLIDNQVVGVDPAAWSKIIRV